MRVNCLLRFLAVHQKGVPSSGIARNKSAYYFNFGLGTEQLPLKIQSSQHSHPALRPQKNKGKTKDENKTKYQS